MAGTYYEYKFIMTDRGMHPPLWINDGGYFTNPADHTFICYQPAVQEYYVPDTLTSYTASELEDRQVAIHQDYPIYNVAEDPSTDPVVMTEAEVRTMVQDWVTARP
jgi:hypothetical protein